MKPLFKYLSKNHAIEAIEEGKFKIGTLFYYRDKETLGNERGDNAEGIKYIHVRNENFDAGKIPKTIKGISGKPGVIVNIVDSKFVSSSSNRFIYCTSEKLNRTLMSNFNCDAIVRIDDPKMFFRELTLSLKNHKRIKDGFQLSPSIYTDRSFEYPEKADIHPALIKELTYSHQAEFRTIWTPIDDKIESAIIVSKKARQYCSLLKDNEIKNLKEAKTSYTINDRNRVNLYFGKKLKDQKIHLDLTTHENCLFERCTIIYGGNGGFNLKGCKIINCTWDLEGGAKATIEFLKLVRRSDPKGVEDIIRFIRE